ncbi:MAG TPA: class I SAM-dependent methyltransferase [Acidimicrobiales bacterium]|nr:class I SAM-dependent methyltransferase [Acidimicrobiales bacterium]
MANERSQAFDAMADAYDRYRPQYPEELFDDIEELAELEPGAKAIEIGAGTGIATGPLISRGLQVVAIEPAPAMSALARDKFGDKARFVDGRFEDWPESDEVELIASFNAWHWVEPETGRSLASRLLPPGGSLALVWTEVLSWGESDFEARLAGVTGSPWPKRLDLVPASLQPIRSDRRFSDFTVRRHRFERRLDAESFVAVTRTYGGHHTVERDWLIRQLIEVEFGGAVTKVEDAVLYLARRR